MKDQNRINNVRKLACVNCGMCAPSQAAHSNSSAHGKGRGVKANDAYTVPLCYKCHADFDQFKIGNRAESEAIFMNWLHQTDKLLTKQEDIF